MKLFKKILKILGTLLGIIVIVLYVLFYRATSPKSDQSVFEEFQKLGIQPEITKEKYQKFDYRKVAVVRDTSLPTIVFVHGTIGSVLDFKRYMTDSLLLEKFNMIVYDRIGYNYNENNSVQESIAFERDMLESITQRIQPEKTILVGYSYGGPIALASKRNYRKVVLLAPAVYSKVEPMPWMLNFYRWKLTRWLVPPIWKQASKEKLTHKEDLTKFENTWNTNPNKVLSIHGDADWIVPYENSTFLENQFPENQFSLVTLPEAGHGLVWSRFSEIRNELLKQ